MKGDEVVKTGKEGADGLLFFNVRHHQSRRFHLCKVDTLNGGSRLAIFCEAILLEALKYHKGNQNHARIDSLNNFNILVDGGWFPQLC